MTDIIKFSPNEYRNLLPILIPSSLFIIYLNWKIHEVLGFELFTPDKFNIFTGILLIIASIYLGIVFNVISLLLLKLIFTEISFEENPSFLFYRTSSGAFWGILITEIGGFLNSSFGKEIAYISVKSYTITISSLLMLILMLILAKQHGEKS